MKSHVIKPDISNRTGTNCTLIVTEYTYTYTHIYSINEYTAHFQIIVPLLFEGKNTRMLNAVQ